MILVPDIETVVLLNPKTGSTSLLQAVLERYPRAMPLYRHMEADGVPFGYDQWAKLIVIREPISRLWSMYSSIRSLAKHRVLPPPLDQVRRNAELGFDDWITGTTMDPGGDMRAPAFASTSGKTIFTRKSQWEFARPDLGTELFRFDDLRAVAKRLDVTLGRHGTRSAQPTPPIGEAARVHLATYFAWDLDFFADAATRQSQASAPPQSTALSTATPFVSAMP